MKYQTILSSVGTLPTHVTLLHVFLCHIGGMIGRFRAPVVQEAMEDRDVVEHQVVLVLPGEGTGQRERNGLSNQRAWNNGNW